MVDTTLTVSAKRSGMARGLFDAFLLEIRSNRIFYLILFTWFAYTVIGSVLRQDGFVAELAEYLGRATRSAFVLGCVAVTVTGIRVLLNRPEQPLKAMGKALAAFLPGRVLLRYAYAFLVFAVFMASFLHNKMLIPQISPFAWDETFANWDRMLFGGYQPWEWLQPIFGHHWAILVLDYAYVGWVPGVFLFWSWMFASRTVPETLRRQYWTATVLSWILLGIVMATALSSVGPCFLPLFFPEQAVEYADLNAYLSDMHERFGLTSSLTKEHLLEVYRGLTTEPGGISAMPSMHNAQAMLFVLAAYRVSHRLGHLMVAYAALIFVASILLAWHYAIDGIIGMAGAALIWWFSSLLSRDRPVEQ